MRIFKIMLVLAIVATILTGVSISSAANNNSESELPLKKENWGSFISSRTELLETLAPPIVHSFQQHDRRDADSPMFDGSWDWHSAVHAAYSLHVLYRETGDSDYMEAIEYKIDPDNIEELVNEELVYMQTQRKSHVYGFAWLLALVKEREIATGKIDLYPLAEEGVSQLRDWIDDLTPEEAQQRVLVDSYANLSWLLIHLQMWAEHTEDEELKIYVQEKMPILLDEELDTLWPVERDTCPDQPEFFPPQLMRLAAVAQIWDAPPSVVRRWIGEKIPKDLWIEPVTEPARVHSEGLNFSRSYCLWHIYRATNQVTLRDNFVHLINYHISRPDMWKEDYYRNSHWVPQFGLRAIEQTFGNPGQPLR